MNLSKQNDLPDNKKEKNYPAKEGADDFWNDCEE